MLRWGPWLLRDSVQHWRSAHALSSEAQRKAASAWGSPAVGGAERLFQGQPQSSSSWQEQRSGWGNQPHGYHGSSCGAPAAAAGDSARLLEQPWWQQSRALHSSPAARQQQQKPAAAAADAPSVWDKAKSRLQRASGRLERASEEAEQQLKQAQAEMDNTISFIKKHKDAAAAQARLTEANLARFDYKMTQLGFVIDPYKGPPAPLGWAWVASKDGRKRFTERFKNWLALAFALANLTRAVPNFSMKDIKVAGAELYLAVNKALAQGQLDSISDMVAASELSRMYHDRERLRRERWDVIQWRLAEEIPLKSIKIVQGRLQKIHKDSKVAFVQITLEIPSRQQFAAYSKKGGHKGHGGGGGASKVSLVAGDPDEIIDVVDHWVIERKVYDLKGVKQKLDPPGARWRVSARLQLEGQDR